METTTGRGRVAVVTGAGGTIGMALCEVLSREGWHVAACDLNEGSFNYVEKVTGAPITAAGLFYADLRGGQQVCRKLIEDIESQLGPVGLLVNNAVSHRPSTLLQDLNEDYCDDMLSTNLMAPLYLCQAAADSLAQEQGSVVNISSVRLVKYTPGMLMYTATKAALEMATVAMSVELGARGVRVNAIRLGGIVGGTSFMRPVMDKLTNEQATALYNEIIPRHRAASDHLTATGRPGTPQDPAELVAFLASDRALFCNGAVIALDAGFAHIEERANDWDPSAAVQQWLEKEGIQ